MPRPCKSRTRASSRERRRRQGRRSGSTSTRGRTGARPSSRSCPGQARVREWPNCRRSFTWSIARSSSLRPTDEPVPSPIRPLLSTCIATRNPARSPGTFSGGTLTSLKRVAEVVRARRPRVVALADLESRHPLLEQKRDVPFLSANLGAGEGRDHVGPRAVSDVALLAVQQPGPVRLPTARDLRSYASDPAPGSVSANAASLRRRRDPEEPRLLLIGPEQRDPEPDRLVDPEDYREVPVDLTDGLEDSRSRSARGPVRRTSHPRRGRGRRSRRGRGGPDRGSSAPPPPSSGRSSPAVVADLRVQRADPVLLVRIGAWPGKASSSRISPRNRDLANDGPLPRPPASAGSLPGPPLAEATP